MNKIIWRDIWQSIRHTKGQFLSILGLMMIGAFALVGLFVTGPDMRATGNTYAQKLNTPDLTVISDYGLDKQDVNRIKKTRGLKEAEFGYMTDTVIKSNRESFRIFSKPKKVGKYELRKGRLPTQKNEIALADNYAKHYRIGQQITFAEKKNILGTRLLKRHSFKIVGFVRSSQILSSVNLGQSTSGSGELKGYAVVMPQNFVQTVYTTANLTYKNLRGLDSYGATYTLRISNDKKALKKELKKEAPLRKKRISHYIDRQLAPQQQKITQAKQKLQVQQAKLEQAGKQLAAAKAAIGQQELLLGKNAGQLAQAKQELAVKAAAYHQSQAKFQHLAGKANKKINSKQRALDKVKRQAAELKEPNYNVYTRREIPGNEGNVVYTTIAQVVDDLAKVFPIFLYFVAALVTFTTMNRFIDEERINSGTLKALGYDDRVIINKFTFYGFISGTLGTIIGIYLGHTLLPQIVYHAYYKAITLPPIEEHFYWPISLIALVLSLLSTVFPAYLTAKSEISEKPAALLLPKPPAKGSKIMLEKIPFIWNHLNFTHKVTARNIFRYKKRMLMTIFGVCGAATLLFAGFSVKNSIGRINERQFGHLIRYDMIVAQKTPITAKQKSAIQDKMASKEVKASAPVHYESLTKVAGKNNDTQDITLIVPSSTKSFANYVHLNKRKTGQQLALTDKGAVVSERLADLLGVNVGDKITVDGANDRHYTIKITGLTEMYMGHFIFMNKDAYRKAFGKNYHANAAMIILKNGSRKNTEQEAAQFMKLAGVAGVVQNTALSKEIDTVVQSLNMIMVVLIVVAGLLAIVIQYNLTNINIFERIRELSTIKVLGFYDNEVTMYIYRETILLTGIGILVGYLTGDLLYRYILYVVPPDNVMFNPGLSVSSFLWPLGVIGLITLILGFVVNNKLKNIDMLEALKSVD